MPRERKSIPNPVVSLEITKVLFVFLLGRGSLNSRCLHRQIEQDHCPKKTTKRPSQRYHTARTDTNFKMVIKWTYRQI